MLAWAELAYIKSDGVLAHRVGYAPAKATKRSVKNLFFFSGLSECPKRVQHHPLNEKGRKASVVPTCRIRGSGQHEHLTWVR